MAPKKRSREPEESKPMDMNLEQLKKFVEKCKEQLTEFNKHLLTIWDTKSFNLVKSDLDIGEILLSWRFKRPELIGVPRSQMEDDCWAHALARAMHATMIQLGYTKGFPTAKLLLKQVDRKFLTPGNGLRRIRHAAPALLEHYGCKLTVRRRPEPDKLEENKKFEEYIERRLATGLVAVCFPYLSAYSGFRHKDKAVFCPRVIDIQEMHCQMLDDHCSVITGRGVYLKYGKCTEFFEIHETRGLDFGDEGFTRLERHKCLISEVYEFEFHPRAT